ncbi:tight adherence pilus pseudopilin TadF [Vibrio sagamiensis]|uniref:Uncharacterized protein n=1 Tax=Vibrio sagamiensis NBRC 104589 TaxID=1219064 RepID=A0A511QH02_9VIBR|nr:tight adherence pilus pseudopilin TadF [Vibrio sagamiensis]PNQ67654.1 hypothetical protein C1141_07950 [Vibrio agarivorans]GEM75722.1 hypothetical protein VSA01S_18340 [Vibrio sagamiensis NBRC 104589]
MKNSIPPKTQTGSAAIEFPFIVLAAIIILWGFVATYRLFNLQIQLDNVTYNLVSALSSTQFKLKSLGRKELPEELALQLINLAERYLPNSIDHSNIGLLLESRIFDEATSRWQYTQPLHTGIHCQGKQVIQKLNNLIVDARNNDPALKGKQSTLIQLTLCVNTPFNYKRLELPKRLSSSSAVIGKYYG